MLSPLTRLRSVFYRFHSRHAAVTQTSRSRHAAVTHIAFNMLDGCVAAVKSVKNALQPCKGGEHEYFFLKFEFHKLTHDLSELHNYIQIIHIS